MHLSAQLHRHQKAPLPCSPLAQVLGKGGVHQQVGQLRVALVRLLDAVQEAWGEEKQKGGGGSWRQGQGM